MSFTSVLGDLRSFLAVKFTAGFAGFAGLTGFTGFSFDAFGFSATFGIEGLFGKSGITDFEHFFNYKLNKLRELPDNILADTDIRYIALGYS